jgi:SAM-dependent methyltransferase
VDDPDVGSFDRRAAGYDSGPLGRWHGEVVASVADLVVSQGPWPQAVVLDVGCGTGRLLEALTRRLPEARAFVGVDPAAGMVEVARSRCTDPRVRIERAAAENLTLADDSVDLVVSSLSFDHWADQVAGMCEIARVLAPGGRVVLADLIAWWLVVGRPFTRRPRARSVGAVGGILRHAGLRPLQWQPTYRLGPLPLVNAVVADSAGPS